MAHTDDRFPSAWSRSLAIEEQCRYDAINYRNLDYLIKELGSDVNWQLKTLVSDNMSLSEKQAQDNLESTMGGSTFYNVLLGMPYRSLERVSIEKWRELIVYFKSVGGDINKPDKYGQNVFMTLVGAEVLKEHLDLLLEQGADPFIASAQYKDSIHKAISNSQEQHANYLIERFSSFMTLKQLKFYQHIFQQRTTHPQATKETLEKKQTLTYLLATHSEQKNMARQLPALPIKHIDNPKIYKI